MSEKKPGKGRGRGYRPSASEAVPPPSQEVVEDLLKDVHVGDTIADGMAVSFPVIFATRRIII